MCEIFLKNKKISLNKNHSKTSTGFTLIELLVVVAIVGILSSVVFSSLSTARKKARDATRKADIQNIYKMLSMYHNEYGGIPKTSSYGEYNSEFGGFDSSSSGGFLTFLKTSGIANQIPVDPINDTTYWYRYYCYPGEGLAIGYTRETPFAVLYYPFFKDPSWTCLP